MVSFLPTRKIYSRLFIDYSDCIYTEHKHSNKSNRLYGFVLSMMNDIKTLKAFSNDWQHTNNRNQCIYTHWTIIQIYNMSNFFSLLFCWYAFCLTFSIELRKHGHELFISLHCTTKQKTILSNQGCHYCFENGERRIYWTTQRNAMKRDVSKVSLSLFYNSIRIVGIKDCIQSVENRTIHFVCLMNENTTQ